MRAENSGKGGMRAEGAGFTKAMRRTHVIYMPDMLPYHGQLLSAAFRFAGYRLKTVPYAETYPKEAYSTVSQDYCSPGIHIIGNALAFVKGREKELGPEIFHRVQAGDIPKGAGRKKKSGAAERRTGVYGIAFLEPQSFGICKAGNLYHALINSLRRSGFSDVPVISLNLHDREKHDGFRPGLRLLAASFVSVLYSDLLMLLTLQVRPREAVPGSADRLRERWLRALYRDISRGGALLFRRCRYRQILESYLKLERRSAGTEEPRIRAGITGEIYSKCAPAGNRRLEEFLKEQGVEYRIGGFLNYLIYVVYTEGKIRRLGGTAGPVYGAGCLVLRKCMEAFQRELYREVKKAGFVCDSEFRRMEQYASQVISSDYNIGDGWLTAAEAADDIRLGYRNVLLCHPFTCLVSHVGSRGVMKNLKKRYPEARVTSIEYDIHGSKAMLDSRVMMALSR